MWYRKTHKYTHIQTNMLKIKLDHVLLCIVYHHLLAYLVGWLVGHSFVRSLDSQLCNKIVKYPNTFRTPKAMAERYDCTLKSIWKYAMSAYLTTITRIPVKQITKYLIILKALSIFFPFVFRACVSHPLLLTYSLSLMNLFFFFFFFCECVDEQKKNPYVTKRNMFGCVCSIYISKDHMSSV